MIKQIETLPTSSKRKSQREIIRDDIMEAYEKGIRMFELEDDRYNYKYLAQYAKDEIDRYIAREVRKEFRKRYDFGLILSGELTKYRTVYNEKKEDRNHVYVVLKETDIGVIVDEIYARKVEKGEADGKRNESRKEAEG